MTIGVVEERPVALIVEDKPRALKLRKALFEDHGFNAIGADTLDAAMNEFELTPAIDIVITDIDLGSPEPADTGVELARRVKRACDVPLVAYSAAVAENDLSAEDWRHFDDHLPKGKSTIAEIERRISEWRALALAYRGRRLALAIEELERIKSKYRILDDDLETLREFLPGSDLPSTARHEVSEDLSPSDLMKRGGYRLRLIEPGFQRPTLNGEAKSTLATIAIWVHQEGSEYFVELYSHSSIYGSADSESKAVENLLLLMDGFYSDFCGDDRPALSYELQQLKEYLSRAFG